MVTLLLAVALLSAPGPRIVAVQEWKDSHPVRAWDLKGLPLSVIDSITHGDDAFPLPKGRIVEILVRVPLRGQGEESPDTYWDRAKGMSGWNYSSGQLKEKPTDSGFSLLAVARSRVASVRFHFAADKFEALSSGRVGSSGQRVNFPHGYRVTARILPPSEENTRPHLQLSIACPSTVASWDIHAIVFNSVGDETDPVNTSGDRGKWTFKYDHPDMQSLRVKISGRRYRAVTFENIPLQPRS